MQPQVIVREFTVAPCADAWKFNSQGRLQPVGGHPYVRRMFNPWRWLRSLEDHTCSFEPTPCALPEWYSPANKHFILEPGLLQVERRCSLTHALAHMELAHSGYQDGPEQIRMTVRQEIQADIQAARWLLPDLELIGSALVWADSVAEAADELWVTEHLLTVRLTQMPQRQKAVLRERLAREGH